jgi:hypothetical protein
MFEPCTVEDTKLTHKSHLHSRDFSEWDPALIIYELEKLKMRRILLSKMNYSPRLYFSIVVSESSSVRAKKIVSFVYTTLRNNHVLQIILDHENKVRIVISLNDIGNAVVKKIQIQ